MYIYIYIYIYIYMYMYIYIYIYICIYMYIYIQFIKKLFSVIFIFAVFADQIFLYLNQIYLRSVKKIIRVQ